MKNEPIINCATVTKHSGVYNLGSGGSITINKLARIMKAVSGKDVPIAYEPQRPADVRHCRADIDKIKRELGFAPSSGFESGLSTYIDWYRNNEV
jgi:nucleoside-diphosphate-sugar epimerase